MFKLNITKILVIIIVFLFKGFVEDSDCKKACIFKHISNGRELRWKINIMSNEEGGKEARKAEQDGHTKTPMEWEYEKENNGNC